MTAFNPKTPPPGKPGTIWNVLSIVMLVMTLCVGVYVLMLVVNPYTALNPLAPPSPTLPFETFTPTPGALTLVPTWTASPTMEPTATRVIPPTFTAVPSATPLMLPTIGGGSAEKTPTATATAKAPTATVTPKATSMPFSVSVSPLESAPINGIACNWLGVAGTAEDSNRAPILLLTVKIGGKLGDKDVDMLTVTGTAPIYGQGAFELVLGDKPIASSNTLWIQLFDQAGLPLSDQVYLTTYEDCKKNLILVRFKKVR